MRFRRHGHQAGIPLCSCACNMRRRRRSQSSHDSTGQVGHPPAGTTGQSPEMNQQQTGNQFAIDQLRAHQASAESADASTDEAMSERSTFSQKIHTAKDFQSTTKMGLFDAEYDPMTQDLNVVVRCRFTFSDSLRSEYRSRSKDDLVWKEIEKEEWKKAWMDQCTEAWSGHHTFFCHRKEWEDMTAAVRVTFEEVEAKEHYHCSVKKIPPTAFKTSMVRSGQASGSKRTPGRGYFDSNDMKPKQSGQIGAVHEAGHMLGLGDEYSKACRGRPKHSHLAQGALGKGVPCGNKGSIMSTGTRVKPEHGVTFWKALEKATGLKWGYKAKKAQPVQKSAGK
jgi:hypothetical protein